MKQVVTMLLPDARLSPQQFWIIVGIAEDEGLSLGELASQRRMDQPTTSRIISTLVRRRLLRNSPDPADSRRSRLLLTKSGRELANTLGPIAAEVRSVIDSALTPGEREAVIEGLRKILARLDQFEAERAANATPHPDVSRSSSVDG